MRKANIVKMTLLATLMSITCRTEAWWPFGKKEEAKAKTVVPPVAGSVLPVSPVPPAKK